MYQHRQIESRLKEFLTIFPAVLITGPRQSGKSTLLKHVLGKKYQYVTFDLQENIDLFLQDSRYFFSLYSRHVIFDEVQKVPAFLNALKVIIDENRNDYGRFVLTGSAQLTMLQNASESLAGRVGLLTLLPFQWQELPESCYPEAVIRGGYPELAIRQYHGFDPWFASYLTTYLEKDIRQLSQIGDLHDFSRFIRLLATQVSQQLNLSSFARDLGISVPTIKRWLSLLEASYIVFLLQPYYKNYHKRIIKNPKIYFYDAGLVAYLTRISNMDLFEHGPLLGPLFENFIIAEIFKAEIHHGKNSNLFYYRTSSGDEIDLIIERGLTRELYEIKHSHTFKTQYFKTIDAIAEQNDCKKLIYSGQTLKPIENKVVIHYKDFLNQFT